MNLESAVTAADRHDLATQLADVLARTLSEAIDERGRATLVVSGGSTPKPLFEELRHRDLPWEHVNVTLADERWVPVDHADSNEAMVRNLLLTKGTRAARAAFVGWKDRAITPEANAENLDVRLRGLRPFDAVVLGMGADGHTASLFPSAPELDAAIDRTSERTCVALHPPSAQHPRLSLHLNAIVEARQLYLHITGEAKRHVLEQAQHAGPIHALPIRAVLRRAPQLRLYWTP